MAQERIPPAPGPGMLWDPVHRRWVKPGQDAPYDKPTRLGPNMFKPWLEIDPEGDVFPWVAPIKPEYQLPGQGIFWHDRTNPEGGGSFSEYPHSPPQEPPTPGSGGSAPWFGPLAEAAGCYWVMGKKINFVGGQSSNNLGSCLFLFGDDAKCRILNSNLPGHLVEVKKFRARDCA